MIKDPKIQAYLRAIIIYNTGLLSHDAATVRDFSTFRACHHEVISDIRTATDALEGRLADDELERFLEKYKHRPFILTDALKAQPSSVLANYVSKAMML